MCSDLPKIGDSRLRHDPRVKVTLYTDVGSGWMMYENHPARVHARPRSMVGAEAVVSATGGGARTDTSINAR